MSFLGSVHSQKEGTCNTQYTVYNTQGTHNIKNLATIHLNCILGAYNMGNTNKVVVVHVAKAII